MKSVKLLGYMLIVAAGSAQLMANPTFKSKDWSHVTQVISLPDLSDEVFQDFSQGKMNDLLIECPEGASLPFKITLDGQFLALESAAENDGGPIASLQLELNQRKK